MPRTMAADQAVSPGKRFAEENGRYAQHGIADHAAETGRQRPMGAARQARRESRRQHGAEQPEQHTQPLAVERPMAKHPVAPNRDRQQQRQRAQAQQLHHQIGGDRAGAAEQIVHRCIGGVAERRVIHRPGGQRQRRHHGETDERNAADFAQPPAQNDAELAGEKGHPVEAAVDHRHRVGFCSLRMILSENRCPLFGIMLSSWRMIPSENRCPLFGIMR